MNNRYINALKLKYESRMEEAMANLELYLSNSNLAAIGEHSDIMLEHDKWIDIYATAKGKLEVLEQEIIKKNITKI